MRCMSEIGDRIAMARALVALPAAELGELAGMSRGVVGMIETDKRGKKPGAETLSNIAAVLGVSSDWILTGVGVEPTKESVTAAVAIARAAEAKRVAEKAAASADAPQESESKPNGHQGAA